MKAIGIAAFVAFIATIFVANWLRKRTGSFLSDSA